MNDEIERLRTERDVEVERWKAALETCRELRKYDATEIERLRKENAVMRQALEIIAGRRQCIDNLMGNVDVACAALDRKP